MGTGTPNHGEDRCRRDVERAVSGIEGLSAAAVHAAAEETVATASVAETDHRSVFELAGLDCRTCAALLETVLSSRVGVSNATASHRHGAVGVDYDPKRVSPAELRTALADLGHPVESTDEAFRNRRADRKSVV